MPWEEDGGASLHPSRCNQRFYAILEDREQNSFCSYARNLSPAVYQRPAALCLSDLSTMKKDHSHPIEMAKF